MQTRIIFLFICFVSFFGWNQKQGYREFEIGTELYAGFSNLGGAFGGELKFGYVINKSLIVGPSFRLQRTWTNNLGLNQSFNIYGGGGFLHYRFQEKLFLGAEFQLLKSPFNFVSFSENIKTWAPIALVGGGLNLSLHEHIKLCAGIFYDVYNADNSPFRSSYNFKVKNDLGQIVRILPVIYRVTFFFPFGQVVN
jgi:hypothetical protein